VPRQQHVGVHAESRAGIPQGECILLAVVIAKNAVATVQRALRHRFEQAESRYHGTGRQHFDLEVATGHVVDLLGEIEGVFVENVFRRPGRLPAHADRAGLGLGDHWKSRCRGSDATGDSGGEELAAGRLLLGLLGVGHGLLLRTIVSLRLPGRKSDGLRCSLQRYGAASDGPTLPEREFV
jgi:hypothetical protein